MRLGIFVSFLALALSAEVTYAEGDAEAGKAKSIVCAACHGADGNSVNPEWPNLAGQHTSYTVMQLMAFKKGDRQNALMSAQALGLSDEDMDDLAAYFGQQPLKPLAADPALASAGEKLYRGGNKTSGVPACAACHGPAGKGNPLSIYPIVAGQHARYTALQLNAYASGERRSDQGQVMRNVAAAMTDAEIEAVSAYIQGLRDSN